MKLIALPVLIDLPIFDVPRPDMQCLAFSRIMGLGLQVPSESELQGWRRKMDEGPRPSPLREDEDARRLVPSLVHLLLLLPASLHSTALSICCPPVSRGVLLLHLHDPVWSIADDAADSASLKAAGPRRHAWNGKGTTATLALAAAVSLAGCDRPPGIGHSAGQVPSGAARALGQRAKHNSQAPLKPRDQRARAGPSTSKGTQRPIPGASSCSRRRAVLPEKTVSAGLVMPIKSLELSIDTSETGKARLSGWADAISKLSTLRCLCLHLEDSCTPVVLRVCRAFTGLTGPSLHAQRSISAECPKIAQLLQWICGMTQLQKLELERVVHWPKGHAREAAEGKRARLPPGSAVATLAKLSQLTGLTQLSLLGCDVDKSCASVWGEHVAAGVRAAPKLGCLELGVNAAVLPVLTHARKGGMLESLQWLEVRDMPESGWGKLAACVSGLSSLTRLGILSHRGSQSSEPIDLPGNLRAVFSGLPRLASLRLRLQSYLPPDAVSVLGDVLPRLGCLTRLHLHGRALLEEDLLSIVRPGQDRAEQSRNGAVTHLLLRDLRLPVLCNVSLGDGERHLRQMAELFARLRMLESVSLWFSGDTPEPVLKYINLDTVQRLALSFEHDYGMGVHGWKAMAAAVSRFKRLEWLSVTIRESVSVSAAAVHQVFATALAKRYVVVEVHLQ